MGIFSEIYESIFGKSEKQKLDEKPSTFGGDGTSPEEAVVVNCASMSMANRIIDDFISDRHGEKGGDWSREFEMFHNSPMEDGPTIRMIGVKLSNDESQTYYFNVSRPMGATMDLINMLKDDG
jgi:hypothetical protein